MTLSLLKLLAITATRIAQTTRHPVTVTLTHEIDLGLFAGFGSFPITLRADATGKSEVYWK